MNKGRCYPALLLVATPLGGYSTVAPQLAQTHVWTFLPRLANKVRREQLGLGHCTSSLCRPYSSMITPA